MASRRRLARTAVMQTLFEVGFAEGQWSGEKMDKKRERDPHAILQRNLDEVGREQTDSAFAESLLCGVLDHGEEIQSAMREHAPQWPLERMDRITRALLMVGTYELLFAGDAPPAVIMNEAIEIAKEFGEEESGKFVNGVLNAIAHSAN